MSDSNVSDEVEVPVIPEGDSPRHGFQGDRGTGPTSVAIPKSLTIAISREAGSRGGSIARRLADKLGWQLYPQDLLDYLTQEENYRQEIADNLSKEQSDWVEQSIDRLLREQNLSRNPSVLALARVILSLGVQGEAILLGRGAGCILPAVSTLHVRIIAPLADRVTYMGQWLRMTVEEAAEQVHRRDTRRAEFIHTHFHRKPSDAYQYDLMLNSSRLGEDRCAELIAQAARAKLASFKNT